MSYRFTGSGRRRSTARETRSKRSAFLERLRKVGGTEQEVEDFDAIWDDPEGWLIPRDVLIRLSDMDLRRIIEHNRGEHYAHTHTEVEQANDELAAAVHAELLAWQDETTRGHTVADITSWVGTSPIRAAVALHHEQLAETPRVTLVGPLEQLVEHDHAEMVAELYENSIERTGDGDETQGIAL